MKKPIKLQKIIYDKIKMEQKNKDFWQKQAIKHTTNSLAVNFDKLENELEQDNLIKNISNNQTILDLGCGNGLTTIDLAKRFQNCHFLGLDFIPEMIDAANNKKEELGLKNIEFKVASATNLNLPKSIDKKFDVIITKRLLINLHNDLKFKAIQNISSLLKKEGKYIMIECFKEPLDKINKIRELLSLEIIKQHAFNEYLNLKILNYLKQFFILQKEIDFESFYYFISRIFNAHLSKGKPDYLSEINKLSVKLSKKGINPIQGYAPEKMLVFKKK